MVNQVHKLYQISQKPERRVIGLMSGTSLDGLDIAICKIHGHGVDTNLILEHFTSVPYTSNIKNAILEVFAKDTISSKQLCQLNAYLGKLHAGMVLNFIREVGLSPEQIDLVASHGQTIFHVPDPSFFYSNSSTLQIGDGDHIAYETGIITISDFRQKHVAAGGEGAPLAMYAEKLLLIHATEHRVLLNIGGIANFTYLTPSSQNSQSFTTDTGPGNTLLDQYCRKYYHQDFDKNGKLAASGQVNQSLLQKLFLHDFFGLNFPKSTGQESFNLAWVESLLDQINDKIPTQDVLATLTRFTAESISKAILKNVPNQFPLHVYTSGGGCHNPEIIRSLEENLPNCKVENISKLGILPDAKEAILFAILGNETVAGDLSNEIFQSNSDLSQIHFGKISFPR